MKPINGVVVRMILRRINELSKRLEGGEVTVTEKASLQLATDRLRGAVDRASVR